MPGELQAQNPAAQRFELAAAPWAIRPLKWIVLASSWSVSALLALYSSPLAVLGVRLARLGPPTLLYCCSLSLGKQLVPCTLS